jgi:uncharacterized cofD-like protein
MSIFRDYSMKKLSWFVDGCPKDCYDQPRMHSRSPVEYQRLLKKARQDLGWLAPGLGVKRWIFVILFGTMLIGLGFAVLVLDIYRTAPDSWWLPVLSFLSLRFLARPLRALIFGGIGLGLVWLGTWGLNRALLKPFMHPGRNILDTVSAYRKRDRGPRIVVMGGGTGLSTLLRGIKAHSNNITAIVSVADDGGSSGELRRSMGVLPPGDIRSCLTALADDETLMGQLFQYRFASGNGLGGHSLGNLLITAMADITGSFEEGVAESGHVLAVRGKVLPATLHDVRLVADLQLPDGSSEVRVRGESNITTAGGRIRRVWLEPTNPLAYPPAVQAILNADLILIGPGSLYTSVLPNLLVPDLADALRVSRALKFYVCNVATQPGETDGYTCGDHVRNLEKHLGVRLFDLVVGNNRYEGALPQGIEFVRMEPELDEEYSVYRTDLVDPGKVWRHDSHKLAQAIMDLFYERTGPVVGREYPVREYAAREVPAHHEVQE